LKIYGEGSLRKELEEKIKKFGKKARENSSRYEENKIMNQWKNLFENLIEK